MLTRWSIGCALICALLLFSSGVAAAQTNESQTPVPEEETAAPAAEMVEALATVQRVAGDVFIFAGGEEPSREAKPEDELFAGDRVEVRKKSKVMLEFAGGILLLLKENSVLALKEPEERQRSVALSKGDLIANIKQALSPGSSFEVETPNALAIVRGTVYEVEVVSDEKTNFYGYEGEVEVRFAEEVLTLGAQDLFKLRTGKPAELLRHSRELSSILDMFSEDYWKEKAKEEVERQIRRRIPGF